MPRVSGPLALPVLLARDTVFGGQTAWVTSSAVNGMFGTDSLGS